MKNLRIALMPMVMILIGGLSKGLAQSTALKPDTNEISIYATIKSDKERVTPPPRPLVSLHENRKRQLKLFPNPSNGNFSLETNLRGTYDLLILDLLGNVHLNKSIYIKDDGLIKVDLSSSAKGLYLVSLGQLTLKFQKI
ncbi:MAG: hypothetical protein ACJAZH_000210 [Roseivirga sp.]|jgi:hypothetical protein